jgi:hypothetical protein
VAVLERICKLCKQPFTLDYCHGRPRSYCFACEPTGYKIVLPKHQFDRVRLRRVVPLVKRGGSL